MQSKEESEREPHVKTHLWSTAGARVDGNMSDNFLIYCTSLDYLCHECPTCYVNLTETDISQEKSDQDVVYGCMQVRKSTLFDIKPFEWLDMGMLVAK